MLEDSPDVGQKAHVEHAVRLVQHQHFQAGQAAVGLPEVVEETARCGHEDVDPAAERLLLRGIADPAEDGGSREPSVARQLLPVLVDLRRQLARGGEDEDPRHAAGAPEKALENRQQERRGLSAPGHGARQDVPARENRRDGVPLDRGGRLEAEGGDAAQEVGVKVKGAERHGVSPSGHLGPASLPRC